MVAVGRASLLERSGRRGIKCVSVVGQSPDANAVTLDPMPNLFAAAIHPMLIMPGYRVEQEVDKREMV